MYKLVAGAILLTSMGLWGQSKPGLLSAADVSKQVQQIQTKLRSTLSLASFENDKVLREKDFEELKTIVTNFVIAHLEAAPKLGSWIEWRLERKLRDQLIQILGVKYDDRFPDHFHEPPYVFLRGPVYPKKEPVVYSIVYEEDVWSGVGGSRIVVESYVIENGKVWLAGRGGSEMDGFLLTR